ncbi:polysaccharide pyruvyl transferase family protein [Amycolatopsis pigmentata]|uniref:Polysaccharide pyruvyl transferase family protein n=1 Tax=Amycolatopsis pigmentata TaxID=450801 RepID=A0ABW5FX85_9PSEU
MRVLVTGWASFRHGEATAGDVLSLRCVRSALTESGIAADIAWSDGYLPSARTLAETDPRDYTHLVFACGPVHGWQVEQLHHEFADCERIAVGVSVLDARDPAVTGFHRVLARDGCGPARADLSLSGDTAATPVAGVIFAPGQAEYGDRRRHDTVHDTLSAWMSEVDCAWLPLDTRLDTTDWRHCSTPDQFASVLSRLDVIVTTRLHGLVLGLRAGVPVLAVDPVSGGGKLTAQAQALRWPALTLADPPALEHWWRWCRSSEGKAKAMAVAKSSTEPPMTELVRELREELTA